MQIRRLYTADLASDNPFEGIIFTEFETGGFANVKPARVMAPNRWSQTAVDVLYGKYMRKAGVPSETAPVAYKGAPAPLLPSIGVPGCKLTGENDACQVFRRIAGHWALAAWESGTLDTDGAVALRDEVARMLALQVFAPNSPQWFNTGLWWAYGITGQTVNWRCEIDWTSAAQLEDREAYRYPQSSACFINSIEDSLIGPNGILDLLKTEASIFKYGSGSGANFSTLRGKGALLSSGGMSSGLMSFLKVFDANAGAIKSGGTTRRAAKMVVVDADHPEAEDFVLWKSREELKVKAMAAGATSMDRSGMTADDAALLDSLTTEFESEAYGTVGGQNSNNSLRVSDEFMKRADGDALFGKLCRATWQSGDPGMQFDDNCNKWHTVPKAGRQNATNPCSEYSFLDDSSCNLASINLIKFLRPDGAIDAEAFSHVVRVATVVLDVTVGMSSYPTKKIAENSAWYRPLGLGYANLGGLLMAMAVPYASDAGRDIAGALTSLMHSVAWRTSRELASVTRPFKDYPTHSADVEKVLRQHAEAHIEVANRFVGGTAEKVWDAAGIAWARLMAEPDAPVRNAQLTLLAPTGTIGLVMDCTTTGVEPDYSLVKHKKLAGGGHMRLVNPLVGHALRRVGFRKASIEVIEDHVAENGRVPDDLPCKDVFACANDIPWRDHLLMMAAVQPFLSGAISKTVNLPNSATVEDIAECYKEAWRLGLKAVAPYRDGSKGAQPLNAVTNGPEEVSPVANSTLDCSTAAPRREKLPNVRRSMTHKVNIGGHAVYLHAGFYPDGRLGEIFLDIGGEGSTMALFMNALARSVSIGLQHGIPLGTFVEAFEHANGEPSGMVQGSEHVRFCASIVDYLARELDACYGSGECVTAMDPQPHPSHNAQRVDAGFTGDPCKSCGKYTLFRSGSCLTCQTCGTTTGCS